MLRLPIPRMRGLGLPVEDGVAFIRWVSAWRPLEISTDDARGYRHPFQVTARWDREEARWECQIFRDSYVGGPIAREVEAPAQAWAELPRATRARYGEQNPGAPVSAWLSEEPWISLPETMWRRVGIDADPVQAGSAEVIPRPILDLGAATGDEIQIDREALTYTISRRGGLVDRSRIRLVRAVDVVLHVARPRVRLGADQRGDLTIELDLPARDEPWVAPQRARWEPATQAESTLEQFAAALEDPGIDEALVARVYLLSRPGAPEGSPIDGTWTAHVDQGLFWNVQHRTNREINVIQPLNLRFPTGLAGGAGDAIIGQVLDDINQRDQLASVLTTQARVRGAFFST
jgi:hypothetical protein